MTGQKDRYSTTEKLWNLDDEQLTTPKHDELVLMLSNKDYSKSKFDIIDVETIDYEVPLKTCSGFIVGYWDVVINKSSYHALFIECKPYVDSFGKVMRQINTYKEYTNGYKIYLFTPDIRFKEAFESQGIKVISP
jgi:hypothetical protein